MPCVLIVDDDAQVRQVLQDALHDEGFRTLLCDGGEAALDLVRDHHPDLIILDAMMPHLDGYQVLWHLRNSDKTRSIPTIMLSARCEKRDIQHGVSLGARAYMVKPFSPEKVTHCVKELLAEQSLAA